KPGRSAGKTAEHGEHGKSGDPIDGIYRSGFGYRGYPQKITHPTERKTDYPHEDAGQLFLAVRRGVEEYRRAERQNQRGRPFPDHLEEGAEQVVHVAYRLTYLQVVKRRYRHEPRKSEKRGYVKTYIKPASELCVVEFACERYVVHIVTLCGKAAPLF